MHTASVWRNHRGIVVETGGCRSDLQGTYTPTQTQESTGGSWGMFHTVSRPQSLTEILCRPH